MLSPLFWWINSLLFAQSSSIDSIFEDEASSEGTDIPQIFFLFMIKDHVPLIDYWVDFFATAGDSRKYKILVHCTEQRCVVPTGWRQVATVPSEWCKNLIGPMSRILSESMSISFSQNDHFVYISDSTLPVKSFDKIYNDLILKKKSNFCIIRPNAWAKSRIKKSMSYEKAGIKKYVASQNTWLDFEDVDNPSQYVAVKHSQWISITKAHAVRLYTGWKLYRELIESKNNSIKDIKDRPLWHPIPKLCLDEYWTFMMIFGLVPIQNARMQIPDLGGRNVIDIQESMWKDLGEGGINDVGVEEQETGTFGRCITFVMWERPIHPDAVTLASYSQTKFGKTPTHYGYPLQLNGISPSALTWLESSDYLFIRKVNSELTSSITQCGTTRARPMWQHIIYRVPHTAIVCTEKDYDFVPPSNVDEISMEMAYTATLHYATFLLLSLLVILFRRLYIKRRNEKSKRQSPTVAPALILPGAWEDNP